MTPSPFEYRPLRDVEEAADFGRIVEESFNLPAAKFVERVENMGAGEFRVVLRQGEAVGVLCLIPMGQWFGGRSVPCTGVALVGVAPEHRGGGAAKFLMDEAVREVHAGGVALSCLFPATQTLYRKSGFETAGSFHRYSMPVSRLPGWRSELRVRPFREADLPAVQDAYTEIARRQNGLMDRGDYLWSRVLEPRGETANGYLVLNGGEVEGYVFLSRRPARLWGYELLFSDLLVRTAEAGRALAGFLSRHRSMAHGAELVACPGHPFFAVLPEQPWEPKEYVDWMLRITSVPAALARRGYPAGVQGELHLAVTDDLLPANQQRFVLRVRDGAGAVEPGGEGRLRVDVRGLASIYSGFLSPWAAAACGRAEGSAAELDLAQSFFTGPRPWMAEIF